MGSNNENIYAEDIWNRIAELLKERSVKQSWLVQRCKEIGMPISQPELSKLYTRKKKINVYELLAIAKALEVSVDFLAYKDLSSGAKKAEAVPSLWLTCVKESFRSRRRVGTGSGKGKYGI